MKDTIADRIKAIRTAAGDSSATVGKRVGVSRQAVDKWERGDTENMKLGNLLRFCDSYHVNVEALIRGEGNLWEIGNKGSADFASTLRAAEPTQCEYHLTTDELRLIQWFRSADEQARAILLRIVSDT